MESIEMTSRGRYQPGSGRLNKGRTSQMRTTMAHLCTFFILLFMFFAASAQTAMAQETPKVSFTQSDAQKTAIVGQLEYERPTLTVLDNNGTSISRYFSQSWSFVDENEKEIGVAGKDALNRPIYTDPLTGSTIIKSYGGLTIGKKYGKVTIKVTLTPTPAYADKYNSAFATFSIDVQKPTVIAEYYNGTTTLLNSNKEGTTPKTLQFYSFKNQWGGDASTSNAVPTAKLYYTSEGNTYDISSYYDYTYAPTSGYKVSDNKISTTVANGEGKLTITATPKEAYKAMLGDDPINVDIDLKTTPQQTGKKIKTYIKFVSNEMDVLRARTPGTNDTKGIQEQSYSPEIRFYDEFGNDITSLATQYDLLSNSTQAQNVFKLYSGPRGIVRGRRMPLPNQRT